MDQFLRTHSSVEILYPEESSFVVCNEILISSVSIERVVCAPITVLRWENNRLFPICGNEYNDFVQQHHMKNKHGCKPVIISPVVLYSDDTSGNRSKKWNKFDCWCLSMAGLPISIARKINNIHFLCCSNRLSALNMAVPIAEDIQRLEQGIEMFDSFLQRTVIVYSPILCFPSEIANHMGSKAKRLCRFCMVESSDPSTVGVMRDKNTSLTQISEISQQRSPKEKSLCRTKYGLREDPNPLFTISNDLYRQIPVEVLHTILLGTCKYMLCAFMDSRTSKEKKEIVVRVHCFPPSGLSSRVTGNICYHYKSFVGRDFKSWMQIAVFIVQFYCTPDEKKCWLLLAKVFRICYCEPLLRSKLDEYRKICAEFVEVTKEYMPMYSKRLKIHLLLILVDCMNEFSPTCCYSTERYESFNGNIRAQNIYGNRQAPSRDIARNFSTLQYLRYICSDGYVNEAFKCGSKLKELYMSPTVQIFLNCLPPKQVYSQKLIYQPGCLRKMMKPTSVCSLIDIKCATNPVKALKQLMQDDHCSLHLHISSLEDTVVSQHGGVVARDGNLVNVGDYVVTTDIRAKYGYVLAFCYVSQSHKAVCIVRYLKEAMSGGIHIQNEFECPILMMTDDLYEVAPTDIIMAVSVVHSCTEECVICEESTSQVIERKKIYLRETFAQAQLFKQYIFVEHLFCYVVDHICRFKFNSVNLRSAKSGKKNWLIS